MSRIGSRETEIKLALADVAEGRRLLHEAGFRVSRRRLFESNTLFDTSRGILRRKKCLLRLRQAGSKAMLTFKGPPVEAKYKDREELEVGLSDSGEFNEILSRLDYMPAFRYEKYRTEYSRSGEPGTATLDETPIGMYLELEGPPAWIDRSARRLGFNESDYITASYYGLYADYCRDHGLHLADMTFRSLEEQSAAT